MEIKNLLPEERREIEGAAHAGFVSGFAKKKNKTMGAAMGEIKLITAGKERRIPLQPPIKRPGLQVVKRHLMCYTRLGSANPDFERSHENGIQHA